MSDVKEAPVEEQVEYSPEEIAEMEAKREEQKLQLSEMYDKEIPFLEKQATFEELRTRIAKARLEQLQVVLMEEQILGSQPAAKAPQEQSERSLRKD